MDPYKNTIEIEGCFMPLWTTNPFGTFTINSVKMPDYVRQISPISIKVYADSTYSN